MNRRALLKAAVAAPVAGYVPTVSTWTGLQLAMRLGLTTVRIVGTITVPAGAVAVLGMNFMN